MFADKYDYLVFLSSESIPFKIKIHKIRTTPLYPCSQGVWGGQLTAAREGWGGGGGGKGYYGDF
jgi:hypothetical protein